MESRELLQGGDDCVQLELGEMGGKNLRDEESVDLDSQLSSTNRISSLISFWDGNKKLDCSRTDVPESCDLHCFRADVPENCDPDLLKSLSKEELVTYFKNIITKMRIDHESTVQQSTEEYFTLKREYLRESQSRRSLEVKAVEKENELKSQAEANERLKQDLVLVTKLLEDKELVRSQLAEAEMELRNQMEGIIADVLGLSNMYSDFECKITEKIKANTLRIEASSSQLNSLLKRATLFKRTVDQQKLERIRVDLHLAETEVDLLGDQVDRLTNLLEKIYVALDHYSPVLRYYPGVVESLKLIRRELSGESGAGVSEV